MIYKFDEFTLNPAKRELQRGAEIVRTEPRTYELLIYLLENRDRAIGKDELQDKVWGTIVSDSAMTRGIMKLRKSLGDTSDTIIKPAVDPRPFPNLMAHLEVYGNETGHVAEVPYSCFKTDAASPES